MYLCVSDPELSDESKLKLGFNNGRMNVWRDNRTANEAKLIAEFTRTCSVSLKLCKCVS